MTTLVNCDDHEALRIACNIIRTALLNLNESKNRDAFDALDSLECHLELCYRGEPQREQSTETATR